MQLAKKTACRADFWTPSSFISPSLVRVPHHPVMTSPPSLSNTPPTPPTLTFPIFFLSSPLSILSPSDPSRPSPVWLPRDGPDHRAAGLSHSRTNLAAWHRYWITFLPCDMSRHFFATPSRTTGCTHWGFVSAFATSCIILPTTAGVLAQFHRWWSAQLYCINIFYCSALILVCDDFSFSKFLSFWSLIRCIVWTQFDTVTHMVHCNIFFCMIRQDPLRTAA